MTNDWEDNMLSETKIRHEKQKYYIDLAEDLGDSITFDGAKATLYIRGKFKEESKTKEEKQ